MAEFRTNGGRTQSGQVLVILRILGARTLNRIDKPVCVDKDGDDLIVAASAGGQATSSPLVLEPRCTS